MFKLETMRTLLFILGFFSFCQVYSQVDSVAFSSGDSSYQKKHWRFGFNVGLQQTFIQHEAPLPAGSQIDNALGYRLGLSAKYMHDSHFFVMGRTELAVNQSSIMYLDTAAKSSRYDVAPTTIQNAIHVGYSFEKKNVSPYVFAGANYKYAFQREIDKTMTFPSGADLAIELGVGLKKRFEYYDLMPEIRYSHGMRNVNKNPSFQSIFVNEFCFALIFM